MPPRARKPAPARSESPPVDHLQLALASQALPPIPAGSAPEPSMRTKPNKETTKNVPPFLTKLYTMVSEPETDHLIRWSEDGDSFFVPSADRVGKELLPRYFKHQNFGSFVRQLNMYGFHKQGVLKRDTSEEGDMLEFSNANFQRGQPDLLCMIHRKVKGDGAVAATADGTLDLSSLLTDLAAIRKHQTAISADLKDLQAKNHALWQEAVQSREKHKKQEETINKILRFLAGVFGGQVLDAGAGASPAQVRDAPGGAQGAQSPTGAAGAAGKGKSNGVVLMPKSRLMLEDVNRRQQGGAGAALQELSEGEDEIEEIPLLNADDDELPTISSAMVAPAQTATMSALSRAPSSNSVVSSSNRFASVSTPSDAPTPRTTDPSQYGLTPEAFSAFLSSSGNNPEALGSFFSQAPSASPAPASMPSHSSATPASSYASTSTALMPFVPASTYNPFENPFSLTPLAPNGSASSSTTPIPTSAAISPSFETALAQSNSALSSVLSEKADIDQRTAALEDQIARLMKNLPDDAREQVENAPRAGGAGAGAGAGGATDAQGTGAADDGTANGFDWSAYTMDDGGIDFDKMLAQFSEIAGPAVTPTSYLLPSASTSSDSGAAPVTDYSDILASSSIDPSLDSGPYSSAQPAPTALPYEVTSPEANGLGSAAMCSPASTATTDAPTPKGDSAYEPAAEKGKKAGGGGGGARKRKSDALGGSPAAAEADSPGPEGAARRSQRKKRA
ncbi:hypothetical protein Rhopal_006156-T1 [Rhodotorula paludigena]|uniref:HSF-type DNA-binding domain-containing protein n=1 Tax=Rhodotorula paludigena TaxID=86838 RepID=A0AAV5GL90_9BASI|nr:hypothetical protein Rhopal_006156-T1 [Rhodotorula paludigena]